MLSRLWIQQLSIPIAFIFSILISKKYISTKNILIFIAIFLIAGTYSFFLFDKAGDGRWYHQETMVLLKHSWNPLIDYSNITASDSFIFSKSYPIANEILATGFYLISGNIQIGKMINTLFAIYCMTISWLFMQKAFAIQNKRDLFILSLLIAFNPIVCSQLFSYYLDGNLFCLFVVFLFSSYYYFIVAKSKFWLINLFSSFLLMANIKATGLVYGVFILIIILAIQYYKTRTLRLWSLIFLFMGTIFLGYHPYIQNILNHHHIFWPVFGHDSVDILTGLDISPYPTFMFPFLSYLIPYPLNFDSLTFLPDIKVYIRTDARFGAVGPFFGVLLFMSCYLLYKEIKYAKLINKLRDEHNKAILSIIFIILLTIFINPKFWFAKYVPQICLLPLLLITLLITNDSQYWHKYKRLIIGLLLINSMLFVSGSFVLTSYRSYLFYKMESACKLSRCVLAGSDNYFKNSLIQQLTDDKVPFSLGNCNGKSIIWEDAKIGTNTTNIMCLK